VIQSLNANSLVSSYRPMAASGNVAAQEIAAPAPADEVSFAPLQSMGGGAVGLKRTGAETASALVSRYFRPDEFQALNSGHYHNAEHPVAVASAVEGLARGYGYSEERVQFLQQVALLHDADERIGPSGEAREGTPARAQVTLEWMDRNQEGLSLRMGWSPVDFKEARALIARTDFPFDEKPRAYGTRYDGKSPVQVYTELLDELPPERRAGAMKDGIMLSFADQTGFYAGSFEMGAAAVRGLAEELKPFMNTTFAAMIQTTPGFLQNAGNSVELDWQIAGQVGVQNPQLPARSELLQAYPAQMRQNLSGNLERFTEIGRELKALPADQQDAQLEMILLR
jgi:hypothetical protein